MVESSLRARRRMTAATMQIRPTSLRLTALGAILAGSIAYRAYRRAIDASLVRVSTGSRIASTRCGPIQYAEAGSGLAALIAHGAGGGFDQGMQFAAPLAQPGLRVIAMSRFGYPRTPLPADASSAAQADAHAALLDALNIDRAAIIGASAGAPSAVEFAIRYPHRCTALVLVVPLAWSPQSVSGSSARSPRFSDRLLSTIVGSDFAFWVFSRFGRDLLIRHVLATPLEIVATASAEERARVDATIETSCRSASGTTGCRTTRASPRRFGPSSSGRSQRRRSSSVSAMTASAPMGLPATSRSGSRARASSATRPGATCGWATTMHCLSKSIAFWRVAFPLLGRSRTLRRRRPDHANVV